MLKLIVNNTNPFYGNVFSNNLKTKQASLPPLNTFLVDFQEVSHNLYIFRAKDFDHSLTCEMTLELTEGIPFSGEDVRDESHLAPILTCNFPRIDESRFNKKVCWDEYLQGILMFQFQLKILEQLFLFCEQKDAINLTLIFNEHNLDYLEIYRRFFVFEEQITTARGEQTKIVIRTDLETYDAVINFLDDVDKDLRQTLWQDQKLNPKFRKYLLNHPL